MLQPFTVGRDFVIYCSPHSSDSQIFLGRFFKNTSTFYYLENFVKDVFSSDIVIRGGKVHGNPLLYKLPLENL
jgi:hypothetical protein